MSAIIDFNPIPSFAPLYPTNKQPLVHEQEQLPSPPSSESGKTEVDSLQRKDVLSPAPPSPPIQQTQNALVVIADRTYRVVTNFPAPQDLAPNEVLICTRAVGLNHIDWKSVDYNYCLPAFPWVTGREMAGVVERIGSAVSNVEVGERVWTSTYYKDRRAGCFQDLVVVPQHTVFRIPTNLDFHAAATLGVPAATAAMTLWRWLDIPMPDTNEPTSASSNTPTTQTLTPSQQQDQKDILLIWGASTTTGQYILQLASLDPNLHTIAICSTSTRPLVASLGATHIVTHNNRTPADLKHEILTLAAGRLRKAIDVVGPQTSALVLDIISSCNPDHTVDFAPLGFMAKGQTIPRNAQVCDVQMKQFILDESARTYGERLNELLEAGMLRVPKLRVLRGGVWAVEEGLEAVKKGNLAGEKLVVEFT